MPLWEFSCYANNGAYLFIPVFNTLSEKLCNPFDKVLLNFSAPVLTDEIKKNIEFTPKLSGNLEDYDPWEGHHNYSQLWQPHQKDYKYTIKLPEKLQAWQVYQIVGSVTDEFGRHLKIPIDMKFKTDHRKPHLYLEYSNAVIEKGLNNDIPLHVTNVKDYRLSYKTLTTQPEPLKQKTVKTKPIMDITYSIPLGIPEILDHKSGLVYGYTAVNQHSHLSDDFLAQMTNYQVYTKFGHHNSLVWVTDMRTGKPVGNADVLLYKDTYAQLKGPEKVIDKGQTNREGFALLKGMKLLDPYQKVIHSGWISRNTERFFIRVKKGEELAFLPLDSNYKVSHNLNHYARSIYGHIHTWGTTPQGIYRVGQKIEYKIWVRDQSNKSFSFAPKGPYHLKVTDPTGKTVYEVKDLELSEFGATHGSFQTTEQSAVGWYSFNLRLKNSYTYTPIRVLVADFTPSPFKVTTELNGDLFDVSETIQASTHAALHSGGPYRDANARIVGTFIPRYFHSKNPILKSFQFSQKYSRSQFNFFEDTSTVNAKGELNSQIPLHSLSSSYGSVRVESAVQDDRGKYITSSAYAKFYGVDRFVGLKNTKWTYKKKDGVHILAAVADPKGEPASGTNIKLTLHWNEVKAIKVKGSGNAFITKYDADWVEEDKCDVISKKKSRGM